MKVRSILITLLTVLTVCVIFCSCSRGSTNNTFSNATDYTKAIAEGEKSCIFLSENGDISDTLGESAVPTYCSAEERIPLLEDLFSNVEEKTETAEKKLENSYVFLQIDSDGYGVCLFKCSEAFMQRNYSELCKTCDYGKTWTLIDKNYCIDSGSLDYAFFDRTFFAFSLSYGSERTVVKSVNIENDEITHDGIFLTDYISDEETCASAYYIKTVVKTRNEDSVILNFAAYSKEYGFEYEPTEEDVFYTAEYDSSLNVIKEISRDDDFIAKIKNPE